MATLKRLSDDDVRSVFHSLHNNVSPPNHLQFQIVPVGPRGLKLSPPSHEFDDGLYVLLRPQKKKNDCPQRVPGHLIHLIMNDLPSESCPWSLSGPQFPSPTTIQQRYCYPKGRLEYSSRKGGALWTMYDGSGREDTEYRLLHVYLSPKRAANKGVDLSNEEKAIVHQRNESLAGATSSLSKRMRYSRKHVAIPRTVIPGPTQHFQPHHDIPSDFHHRQNYSLVPMNSSSPTPTTGRAELGCSTMVPSPPSLSPLSFDRYPTDSLHRPGTVSMQQQQQIASKHQHYCKANMGVFFHQNDDLRTITHRGEGSFDQGQSHALRRESHDAMQNATFVTPVTNRSSEPTNDRVFPNVSSWDHHVDCHHPVLLPVQQRKSYLNDPRADPFWVGHSDHDDQSSCDDFDLSYMKQQQQQNQLQQQQNHSHLPNSSSLSSLASSDPFASLVLSSSKPLDSASTHKALNVGIADRKPSNNIFEAATDASPSKGVISIPLSVSLKSRLDQLQRSIRNELLSISSSEQGDLLSVVVDWATRLRQDPLQFVDDDNNRDNNDEESSYLEPASITTVVGGLHTDDVVVNQRDRDNRASQAFSPPLFSHETSTDLEAV